MRSTLGEGDVGIPNAHSNGYANGKTNGFINQNGINKTIVKLDDHDNQGLSDKQVSDGPMTGSSFHQKSKTGKMEEFEETPFHIALICYFSYAIVILFGHLRDFMRRTGIEKNRFAVERNREGYVPLYQNFESFYTRNIYRRICHAWNMPIASMAGEYIDVLDRTTEDYNHSFNMSGSTTRAINMGSYNYLGFAENSGPRTQEVEKALLRDGVGVCTSRHELGTLECHRKLEETVAKFLGVEDSVIFGMGFATNSTNIPTIVGKGCLILSDELNHASMILGCRLSGAVIKVFKHNNVKDLEKKLRQAIVDGQPRSHRPWKKIIIFVEGIYSMEGTSVKLPEIIELKKKYKAYLYLDEAHSIGAMGPSGRGMTDYYGCDAKDVDLLMGTFTKSFGAAGGYLAGSKELIDHIRINSHSFAYATSMSPPVCQQIQAVFEALDGEEGKRRVAQLSRNTQYFRRRLKQLGFIVYGHEDSPVVPMLIYFPCKIVCFVKAALEQGVAAVGAGFPATPLIESRVRFCLSAAHTKEMLDQALEVTSALGDRIWIKYSNQKVSQESIPY